MNDPEVFSVPVLPIDPDDDALIEGYIREHMPPRRGVPLVPADDWADRAEAALRAALPLGDWTRRETKRDSVALYFGAEDVLAVRSPRGIVSVALRLCVPGRAATVSARAEGDTVAEAMAAAAADYRDCLRAVLVSADERLRAWGDNSA